MHKCEVCGNEYRNLIEIKLGNDGHVHRFDCFECALFKLAPKCSHCGVRVLGHGVEVANEIFCGAHCARAKGHSRFVDHLDIDIQLPL